MRLHVGPIYWIKSSHHLVFGRPRGLLFQCGIHAVTLIVHLLSRLLATCPGHLCLLSLILLLISVTPLCFRIHFVLFLFFRVTPIMILSIFLWVVTGFSSWVLLRDQVSQPYVITGSIHSLNAFLVRLIGTFCLAWCCPVYRMHSIPVRFSFSFLAPGHGP